MPFSFSLLHLTPVNDGFSQLRLQLNLQIDFVDRHIDLLAEGYELAILVAKLKDSILQAKRLTIIQLSQTDFLQYGNESEQLRSCVG